MNEFDILVPGAIFIGLTLDEAMECVAFMKQAFSAQGIDGYD